MAHPHRDSAAGQADRGRTPLFAIAVFAALAGLWFCSGFYHDDAYITLRYADRLLHGRGLTWSDGDRVEGFTHPLWLGLIALAGAVGAGFVTASRVLGLTAVVVVFAVWWKSKAWAAPLLIVATLPGLALWAWGGLETAGFCAWMLVGAWLAVTTRDRLAAAACPPGTARAAATGLAFAAAALTRPEGLGAGLIAVVWIAFARRLRPAVAATAGLLLPVGAYLAFRIFYYGDTVPNPAHVKVEGLPLAFQLSSAGYYLRNSLPLWLPGAMGSLCALALASGKSVRLDPAHASAGPLSNRAVPNGWFVAALTLPILSSTAVGGGDHMPGARFLVPVVVLLAFAAAVAGPPAASRRKTLALGALAAATLAQAGILLTMPVKYDRAAAEGEPIGRFLEKTLSSGSLVSTATAGSEAFFAPSLRFLDPLGLNDRHIARRRITEFVTRWQVMPGHAKGDGPYVLSRRPDVVILGRARGFLGTDPKDWFLTDFELLGSDEFHLRYRPYRFAVPLRPLDASRLGVARDGTRPPTLELTAYLRSDSPAASALAREGEPLTPPWLAAPRP